MNRQPQLMDRSQMQHILASDLQKIRQQVYFDNELGIVHGDSTVFKLIMKQKRKTATSLQVHWPIWGLAPSSCLISSRTTLKFVA